MTAADSPSEASFALQRDRMVTEQIAARGVRDPRVLAAMRRVPREAFLPADKRAFAYDDAPVPIAAGQTMSQPYIVALMAEALGLTGGERVLEIGTGSGYAAAVLAELAAEVFSVERIDTLADAAAAVLGRLGIRNLHLRCGDGTLGWREHAPFAAIVVAAGGPQVPASLKRQLIIGGRLVMPVGPSDDMQRLVRVTRQGEADFYEETLAEVRFVPLLGAEGFGQPPR
ncbi:protein-L-isoaspartate(D-aspartate) O-methyltransferase [Rhodopseudomonas sp. B29]|uniref:protein-L-isoaspartate(D-aspartate) O-methyltransferase n=1 Tax=Rhodopseudomonas sp. B29 TaxID=95607 RepID=UPI0003486BB7|nr:protein-L-isoaspartate(D-aspartate) O-methyltransferase [Rhodopseudomonas sp. B29]